MKPIGINTPTNQHTRHSGHPMAEAVLTDPSRGVVSQRFQVDMKIIIDLKTEPTNT